MQNYIIKKPFSPLEHPFAHNLLNASGADYRHNFKEAKIRKITLQRDDNELHISFTLSDTLAKVTFFKNFPHKDEVTIQSGFLPASTNLATINLPMSSPLVKELFAALDKLDPFDDAVKEDLCKALGLDFSQDEPCQMPMTA